MALPWLEGKTLPLVLLLLAGEREALPQLLLVQEGCKDAVDDFPPSLGDIIITTLSLSVSS